ncbi:hypothetical protein BJX99DRAFT_141183 [Aspergillus californicus]
MKLTTALASGLLATTASAAFDKWSPWGRRDYSCVNVYQGIPENATLAADANVDIAFNRNSGRCGDLYDQYPTSEYSLWLWNNPFRGAGYVTTWDARVQVKDGIPADADSVTFSVPDDLPAVNDDTVWYLRLDTTVPDAPQYPSLFYAMGPFKIER